MSTQQDIYAAGSESRPFMLNKENYVPWSSRLLQYAKSRSNGKLIHNSILNGPYVKKMIPEPGDVNRDVNVTETFHLQTDDELSDKKTKDLHTADYTQLYDFLKYNQKEVDELKAERIAKTQDPLTLMANSNNPYNYLQQPIPNPEDITDPTTAMNMALALMAKAFKLNYSTPTNNNQRISSNPMNRQIAQPGLNMGQDRQMQMVGGMNMGQDRQMQMVGGNGGNQFRRMQGRMQGIRLEEYDLMAAAADLDEIEEVNANCILMANLQQASTLGTQTNSAPIYDTNGSAEVIQICLWCVNSSCSKHMTRNLKLLINFIWKFMGTVRFGNDH
nr:integrase, catalytic region, zinc finger, CCHC-type, peptidase aspartic, catalytic [Tanacetum cinerariifolium]